MKKIAYLIPSFPVFSETFIGTEIRAMEKIGHEIITVAFDGKHARHAQPHDKYFIERTHYLDQSEIKPSGQCLALLGKRGLSLIRFILSQKGVPKRSLLYAGCKLAKHLEENQCEHIHAHFAQSTAATAIVAGLVLGIPVSFVGHGHDIYASPYDLKLKLQYSDLIIAVCQDMMHDFKALSPKSNVQLVYCGIEPKRFEPCERFPTETNMGLSKRLLFVGRLTETKGIADILEAIYLLKNDQRPSLDIVGEGELMDSLKKQVQCQQLTKSVRFLGKRSSAWISEHCSQYRSMICPFKEASNGNRDTGPVVVKEAMAMGMPVITTHFMGCKEMVTKETGIKVPSGDVKALSEAIITMMGFSRSKWQERSLASIERVHEHYTADKQAGYLSRYIQSLES